MTEITLKIGTVIEIESLGTTYQVGRIETSRKNEKRHILRLDTKFQDSIFLEIHE